MLLDSFEVVTNYPNEKIRVFFKEITDPVDNARLGIRFRYFYYDTHDQKINFSQSPDYTIVATNPNGETLSARTPTNFLNPTEFTPFVWDIASDREYLYLTLLGGVSSVTVWPSHPYPRITKNSETSISIDVGVASASAFNGEMTTPAFRKHINSSNFESVNFDDSVVVTSTRSGFISRLRKNFDHAENVNLSRTFNTNSLGVNVIPNSLQIDIPVILSATVIPDQLDQIFVLKFFSDAYSNNEFNSITNASTNLSCLVSEALNNKGISYPYTSQAKLVDSTGTVAITFNAPIFIQPHNYITVSYETSSATLSGGITFTTPGVNLYNVSVNNAVYAGYPVYLFNYNFASATRDLFTISFAPSSITINPTLTSVSVSTVMVDNYYQTSYGMPVSDTVLLKRFVETTGDYSLSAVDPAYPSVKYKTNQWFPANRNIKFINDGNGNKYSVKIQLKSIFGAIYEEPNPLDFILNKDKIIMNLSLTDVSSTSATSNVTIFPTPSEDYRIKWDVSPSDNILFQDYNGNTIPRNTLVPADYFTTIKNLGVDKTEIILYSEEYDLSASTFWFPPSGVFGDVAIQIQGDISDDDLVNYGSLSAVCRRNGLLYKLPTDSNIIWNETTNDTRGSVSFFTNDNQSNIQEAVVYASSSNYSLIKPVFTTIPVDGNPKSVIFNISCNLFRGDFNFTATKLFSVRQYPKPLYLVMRASGSDGIVYSGEDNTNVVYTTNQMVYLSAYHPLLTINPSQLLWSRTNSNGSTVSGTGETFNFNLNTISACVTLSGISGKPVEGNFQVYNFTDKMCFFNLSATNNFDYIAFPSNIFVPTLEGGVIRNTAPLNFTNYTNSQGLTSFDSCHTEIVNVSATPGFDTYAWQIGSKITESVENTASIPIVYNDVSGTNIVSVSAFNSIFRRDGKITSLNSAVSDNSNRFRQPFVFYNFPSPSATIGLSNTMINTDRYSETTNLNCVIDTEYASLNNYTLNIVLSSSSGIQTKPVNNNQSTFNSLLNIGIANTEFIIKENSYNAMVAYVSGNIGVTIPNFDFCPEQTSIMSNVVHLTAYNGPNLELYTTESIVSTYTDVVFYNNSNLNFQSTDAPKFTSFVFDNGEGVTQTTSAFEITASYTTEGSKSPAVTGYLNDGRIFTRIWNDMITVKNGAQSYNYDITREFYKPISLPYSLSDTLIKPNDWQYASTINSVFDKIANNIDHLSAMGYINNINFPKAYGGFLGSKFGNFKWHMIHEPVDLGNDIFFELKSAQIIGEKMLAINNHNICIYDISTTPSLLHTISRIGDGETLQNPIKLFYNDNTKILYILDNARQLMFICNFDIDDPSSIKLTHYWGGVGERTDRTKLNDPIDFCIDSTNNLFIADRDAKLIKVYNKNLNWIRNIEMGNRPLSIHNTGERFCVTLDTGTTIIMDRFGNIENQIEVSGSSNSILNNLNDGIIYIVVADTIHKYTTNGTYVTQKLYPSKINDIIFDTTHGFIICSNFIIRFIDFIQIETLFTESQNISAFSRNNFFINEHEFVTSYVYNDSFKKIFDNIIILNNSLSKKLNVDLDGYGAVITQYSTDYTAPSITATPVFLADNEPVLYDTINRQIINIFDNLDQLREHLDVRFNYPSNMDDFKWRWINHYIDRVQGPTLDKNPVTWSELKSSQIIGSTTLSSISSWGHIREGLEGNHGEICWNYQSTESNSYFPLTWADVESYNNDGQYTYALTWADLEDDCCKIPDIVFADCISAC